MGIAEDFYGMKYQWSKLSISTKIFFIFSFSLTVLSIGSLADSIFAFKGFIVDAIVFYDSAIDPIWKFLSELFNVEIAFLYKHLTMLVLLLTGIYSKIPSYKKRERDGIIFYVIFFMFVTFGSVTGYYFIPILGATKFCLLACLFLPFFLAIAVNKKCKIYKWNVLAFLYVLFIYFTVAILAAISAGLTRPLSGS
ncbi:MAG: hypothetical protein P8I03_09760 [Thalassotalea sp.]|nr:hypothetical protein [Thalassotalea sp.]